MEYKTLMNEKQVSEAYDVLVDNMFNKMANKLGIDTKKELSSKEKDLMQSNMIIGAIKNDGLKMTKPITSRFNEKYGLDLGEVDIDYTHRADPVYTQTHLSNKGGTNLHNLNYEGKHVFLFDSVIQTGRTAVPVMNELFDYGRPSSINLYVMLSRDGREMPIGGENVFAAKDITLDKNLEAKLIEEEGKQKVVLRQK